MTDPLDIVIFGLTLSSTWGNGHATTYRALLKGLERAGHRVLFLERDKPWYARARDLPDPGFCDFALYDDIDTALEGHAARIAAADIVIVGSYVPEGARLIDRLRPRVPGLLGFYDIDTPVTLAALAAGGDDHLAPRQVGLFDLYFSFAGGPALSDLRRRYGARCPVPLYCSVDPDEHRPLPGVVPRWDLGYLGTYSPDRQDGLERLLLEPARRLPDRRFVVAGPGYPGSVRWPANVDRIEHLPAADHREFYAAQRFTLNLTRAAMRAVGWSPSVRLFEAAACGTPVISDDWPGLERFFPDTIAILVAQTTSDVVEAICRVSEPMRRGIARQARARVLTRHSGRARARECAAVITARSRAGRAAATTGAAEASARGGAE